MFNHMYLIVTPLTCIQKIKVTNLPRPNYFVTWLPIIVSCGTLVFSIYNGSKTSKRNKKLFRLQTEKEYVQARTYLADFQAKYLAALGRLNIAIDTLDIVDKVFRFHSNPMIQKLNDLPKISPTDASLNSDKTREQSELIVSKEIRKCFEDVVRIYDEGINFAVNYYSFLRNEKYDDQIRIDISNRMSEVKKKFEAMNEDIADSYTLEFSGVSTTTATGVNRKRLLEKSLPSFLNELTLFTEKIEEITTFNIEKIN